MSWRLVLSVARLSPVAAQLREKAVEDGWVYVHSTYAILAKPWFTCFHLCIVFLLEYA